MATKVVLADVRPDHFIEKIKVNDILATIFEKCVSSEDRLNGIPRHHPELVKLAEAYIEASDYNYEGDSIRIEYSESNQYIIVEEERGEFAYFGDRFVNAAAQLDHETVMGRSSENFKMLIDRYKGLRTVCNCGEAYRTPKPGFSDCAGGCSSNIRMARDEVASRVVAEFNLNNC